MLNAEKFEEWLKNQPSDVERSSAYAGWCGAVTSGEFHTLQKDFEILKAQKMIEAQNEAIRGLLELCLRLSEQVCKK